MEDVGEALRELENKMSVALESLQENDSFIDVAINATQIALRTSITEKKEALRNAILNSALPNSPEESFQKMFLYYIDTFTVWHLRLLDYLNDPLSYVQRHDLQNIDFSSMTTWGTVIESTFPDLRGKRDLYESIWKDLRSRTLVDVTDIHLWIVNPGTAKRTTSIGELFLDYISNPFTEK